MANPLECRSCGYICHSEDTKCPYCGTPTNHGTSEKKTYQINKPELPNFTFTSNSRDSTNKDSDINVCILVLLVVLFWPAAIIYVVVKLSNKK